MSRRVLALLALVVFAELAAGTLLAEATSAKTLAIVLGIPSLIGALFFATACFIAWRRATRQMAVGSLNEGSGSSLALLLAAFLLLLPGILTDLFAVAILATPLRRYVGSWLKDRMVGGHKKA